METNRRIRMMAAACALIAGLSAVAPGRIIYVDDDAIGANDGASWTNAFPSLQDALAIAGNWSSMGSTLGWLPGSLVNDKYRVALDNCIVWDGPESVSTLRPMRARGSAQEQDVIIRYGDVLGDWPGDGNIHADPLFARPGSWVDAANPSGAVEPGHADPIWVDGDYHVKSRTGRWDPIREDWVQDEATSPCIDAGDPTTPVGDEPEPNGGRINLGACGGTAEASKS